MWLLKDFKIQIIEKTLWTKVKLLILSNFTFVHNVFLKLFFFNVLKSVYMEERVKSHTCTCIVESLVQIAKEKMFLEHVLAPNFEKIISFYTPEGSYYVIPPVVRPSVCLSVRPLAISCVRNSSYSFHWNYLKLATMNLLDV